ncbi:MAG: hypothetical protein JSR17_08920 [Proteobacteria bacterium]|nr:hypothetical protein [Pseudomonadota bacterium]
MQTGPDTSTANRSPFKLKKAAKSPTKLRVMMSLPDKTFLEDISKLPENLSNEISTCFRMIFSHVVERGAHSQGQPHFFHHVAATALYESYNQFLIHDKDHGLKAGPIYNKVKKVLEIVEKTLIPNSSFSAEQRSTLEDVRATLIAHHNAFVLAIQSLSAEQKQKLKINQSIDAVSLQELPITPKKAARIKKTHPFSPDSHTPKKLSAEDERSKRILEGNPHPPARRPLMLLESLPLPPLPQRDALAYTPRVLLLKMRAHATPKAEENSAVSVPRSPKKTPGK